MAKTGQAEGWAGDERQGWLGTLAAYVGAGVGDIESIEMARPFLGVFEKQCPEPSA